jgi:hypothetical protein
MDHNQFLQRLLNCYGGLRFYRDPSDDLIVKFYAACIAVIKVAVGLVHLIPLGAPISATGASSSSLAPQHPHRASD